MPRDTSSSSEIKWGALAATAMVLLSLIPQIHLWFVRGRDWNGGYATIHGDEFLYSAYINALIDGRPRLNDPFAGRDSTPNSPMPESTFSIQFIPAYLISSLASALGASAATAFIVLLGMAGLLASLSVFWLLTCVTGNGKLAAVGVLVVLCCGALAGDQGLVGILLNHKASAFMPFLRRYQPSAVFPLFFVFCGLVWRGVNAEYMRRGRLYATAAGLILAVLVFSYLYLWTAAAAWLVCFALLWFYLRPQRERRRSLELFVITASLASIALIPYAYLISHRAKSLDQVQIVMILTRQLDLFHTPEIIGAFILAVLVLCVRWGKVRRSEPRLIFAASLALLPLILFNQQLLTGRSVQPLHFNNVVANYAVLLSLVIMTALFWERVPNRALLWTAALCFSWGAMEIGLPALVRSSVVDDQMVPVLLRLKELSTRDGTMTGLRNDGKTSGLVFSPHFGVMRLLPTWTSQGTLLADTSLDFGTSSEKERKELLYMHLYYLQTDGEHLRELLNQRSDDRSMSSYTIVIMFGIERLFPTLSLLSKPIQQDEIEEEVRAYQAYADSFSREKALRHPLLYVVTRGEEPDLSHIDRWYERDAGEWFGGYTLYRLNLRK